MRSCQSGGGVHWCRAAILLLTLCLTNKCGSAITFEEFVGYPFNESNGYSIFPRGLDLMRGLPIPVPFSYFGRTFSYANIDDSGYISLLNVNSSDADNLPLSTPYTPQDFPLNTSNTILSGIDWGAVVAPYWYDVDTRGNASGRIYYKNVTRGTDANLIGEIDSLATPHLCGFTSTWALIVTWDHVGYFNERSDKLNTFQVVLATDGQRSLAVFNYAEDGINWAGGDAFSAVSGAVAGYNVGDDDRYFKFPESLSEDIQHIDNITGNTGRRGQWVFLLDDIESLTPPTQLAVLEISPTSFTVSWMPPLGEFRNGSISYYLISVTDAEGDSVLLNQHTVNDTTLQLRVAELLPGRVHQVSVAAVSGQNIGLSRTVWIRTSLCADVNECESESPCHTNASCTNTLGSFTCGCNAGYSGDGMTCYDINECVTESPCHSNASCTNTLGSFACACDTGYSGDGVVCYDLDECVYESPCHANASCTNTLGSFTCACDMGYTGDGVTCYDIDECVTLSPCHANASCISTLESFTCVCNTGYTGDGITCYDINECVTLSPCHTSASCTNTLGSFTCACNTGYSGDGITCYDIDECVAQSPCHESASCTNTLGSFTCGCNTGYSGDGTTCNDINECVTQSPCHTSASCTNTLGSFTCACNTGYSGDGATCSDINECVTESPCHTSASCTNTLGSFSCECNAGYSGDGMICNDINECVTESPCDPNASCTNTPGSFTCECNTGYRGDGMTCYDINECVTESPCHASASCTNTLGSFTCACNTGYSGDGTTCHDINECVTQSPCHANASCTNSLGSFTCACNTGYSGDGVTCYALLTPPAQLTVLEISPTSFTVSWMPPLGEFGNGSISYYFISVTDAEEESMVLLQDEVNETTLQLRVAELLPGSVHLVSVAAVSGEDIGPARTVWIKTNQLAKPLTSPTQLAVLEISPTSFTVSWGPPLGVLENKSISYYHINVTDTEGDSAVPNQHTVNGTTLQLRIAELLPGHVHRVSVAAVSGDEIGPIVTVFAKTSPITVASTTTDFNTTVTISSLGGLLGLLLLIVVGAVILGLCVKLCACHKKRKYIPTDDKTAADYDVVQMVSMQENPAYADVHIIRTDNNYM